jgi:hypothetical protein
MVLHSPDVRHQKEEGRQAERRLHLSDVLMCRGLRQFKLSGERTVFGALAAGGDDHIVPGLRVAAGASVVALGSASLGVARHSPRRSRRPF